jgi:hypothetical protein
VLSVPRLEILNRGLLEGWRSPSHLAWAFEARTGDRASSSGWMPDAGRAAALQPDAAAKEPHGVRRGHSSTLPGTLVRAEAAP